jgi:putative transposase
VRVVKSADGVYVQFCVDLDRKENTEPSGTALGLDVGLKKYYTDSNGVTVENPKFLRIGEKVLKRSVRRVSRKVRGSKNRAKARQILGKRRLKISRQPYWALHSGQYAIDSTPARNKHISASNRYSFML